MTMIGYDFDGVLCDTMPAFLAYWKAKYDWVIADFDTRQFEMPFQPDYNFKDVYDDIAESINEYNAYCYPHAFAMELVREMANRSNEVPIIITARVEENRKVTEMWLQHWLGIPYELELTNGKTKAELIAEHDGMLYYIEDRFQTVNEIAPVCEKVYMPTRVWNTGRPLQHDNIMPVANLIEVYNDIFGDEDEVKNA